MDVHKILAELYAERQGLDDAIAAVEGLASTGQRRRGRPPKWLSEASKSKETDQKQSPAAPKPRRRSSKRKPK